MPRRTRYTGHAGFTRPIPYLLAARLRLAPRWAWKYHKPYVFTTLAVAFAFGLAAILAGTTKPACQPETTPRPPFASCH